MCLLLLSGGVLRAQVYLNYSVTQPAALSADAGGDQLICLGETATLGGAPAAAGGYGSYAYLWSGTGVSNPTTANPTATPTVASDFMLTVTDSLGCTAFDTVTVAIDTCVGLQNLQGVTAFEIFPNPNMGQFTVEIQLAQQVATLDLTIIDMAGRELYRKTYVQPSLTVREYIALSGLSRGTYFVRMVADGQLVSRKMILR